ncbi:MAG: hypothetical protein HC942_09065 [Microcoleus sp. SU_5_6]|nr:hypothetical protein [Microcoleus sp. SU_5_6]
MNQGGSQAPVMFLIAYHCAIVLFDKKSDEGRRQKAEGRRMREEGRRKKEERRRMREEG